MNHGDNYDTHPFDLTYMLRRWALRQSDVIWDPFVNAGSYSQRYIESQGYQVYHGTEDVMALERAPDPVTLIITNPPYSNKDEVLAKLKTFEVPFVLLVPTMVIQRDYFTNTVASSHRNWHVVLPNKSLVFHVNGEVQPVPAFKSCFIFSCPAPPRMQQSVELNRIENVTLELLDYAAIRRQGGFSSADFNTE